MYIRDEVRERWAAEGILDRKNARVAEFLAYIDEHPFECWDEYIAVFRRDYYDLFDDIVLPLVKTRDKVLKSVLIARADLKAPKELAVLKDVIRKADPIADQVELRAIARRGDKVLIDELKKHGKIPEPLRDPVLAVADTPRPVTNLRKPPAKRARTTRTRRSAAAGADAKPKTT